LITLRCCWLDVGLLRCVVVARCAVVGLTTLRCRLRYPTLLIYVVVVTLVDLRLRYLTLDVYRSRLRFTHRVGYVTRLRTHVLLLRCCGWLDCYVCCYGCSYVYVGLLRCYVWLRCWLRLVVGLLRYAFG